MIVERLKKVGITNYQKSHSTRVPFLSIFYKWPFHQQQFYPQKLNFCDKSILFTFENAVEIAQNTVSSFIFTNEAFKVEDQVEDQIQKPLIEVNNSI